MMLSFAGATQCHDLTTTLQILPPPLPPPQSNYGGRKMHPSVVAYLREFYRPSVHDLYRLLGRDLGWEGFGSTAGSVLPGTFGSGGGDGSGGKARLPLGVHQRWAGTMTQLSSSGWDGQQEGGGEESSEPSKKGSGQPSEEAGRPRVFQLHARHDSAHDSAHSAGHHPPIPSSAVALLSGQPLSALGVAAAATTTAVAAASPNALPALPAAPSDTSDGGGGESIGGELPLANGTEAAPKGAFVLEVLPTAG